MQPSFGRQQLQLGEPLTHRDWLLFVNRNDGRVRSGALCSGDSGSPQFLGGSNIQVSLLHDAGASCSGIGYSQRLDTPAEQRFLAPYLPQD